jgi:hypothetical protein
MQEIITVLWRGGVLAALRWTRRRSRAARNIQPMRSPVQARAGARSVFGSRAITAARGRQCAKRREASARGGPRTTTHFEAHSPITCPARPLFTRIALKQDRRCESRICVVGRAWGMSQIADPRDQSLFDCGLEQRLRRHCHDARPLAHAREPHAPHRGRDLCPHHVNRLVGHCLLGQAQFQARVVAQLRALRFRKRRTRARRPPWRAGAHQQNAR